MSTDKTSQRRRPDLTFHPDILGIPAQFRVVDTVQVQEAPGSAQNHESVSPDSV
ncbi:hypothetical protein [Rhodococcus erythropolis]|uniref:hypothetical protein n=1 Tax=Rhodococcus erythropolis TaxID=1833 RepID=UPI001BE6EBA5|nr:hypothetical protein [Rhodococcus erythropolis]MBT2269035.1 hypothetical protein [Rhodococcus erythropolis]